MNSAWARPLLAMIRKELRIELRARTSLWMGLLFGLCAVVAVAFATAGAKLEPKFASGVFWITILFSSVVSLPRIFLIEEDLRTTDFLKLSASPYTVFWGKFLFSILTLLIQTGILLGLFLLLNNWSQLNLLPLVLATAGGAVALAGGIAIASSIACMADSGRGIAAVLSLPLVLPVAASFGVMAMSFAFGGIDPDGGWRAIVGLWSYGVISAAIGPHLFAVLWRAK